MDLPKRIKHILEKVVEGTGFSIEFWNDVKGEDLYECFFDLSSELMGFDLDIHKLPEGYRLVGYIYYWETNCQFSGWYAIQNKKEEIRNKK